MKSLPFLLALFIIAFLSWNWGGVAPEAALIAAAGGLLVFLLSLAFIASAPSSKLSWSPDLAVSLVPLAGAVLVAAAAPLPGVGKESLWLIGSLCLFFSGLILFRSPAKPVGFFFTAIGVWAAALAAAGCYRQAGGPLGAIPLAGTFVNRNHFCAFLGIALAPVLSLGLFSRTAGRLLYFPLGLLLSLGILLTRSRGGGIAAALSVLLVGFLYFRTHPGRAKSRLSWLLLIVLLGSGAAGVFRSSGSLPAAPSLQEPSVQTRVSIAKSLVRMFLDRPLFGWGWGTFPFVYLRFKDPGVWYRVDHGHNEYLQLLAEGGLAGFGALGFSLAWIFRRLLSRYRSPVSPADAAAALGAAGSLAYALVHSGFDFILRIPANSFALAAITGLALGARPDAPGRRPGLKGFGKIAAALGLILAAAWWPGLPVARSLISYRYWKEGKTGLGAGEIFEAERLFSRAVDLRPDRNEFRYARAAARWENLEDSQNRLARLREIRSDLDAAADNNPGDPRPLVFLARYYSRLGSPEEALQVWRQTLERDQTNPFLWLEAGRAELRLNRPAAAAQALRRAVSIYPSMWDAALALLTSRTKDYRILKNFPPDQDIFHCKLGYHLMAGGQREAAGEEFRRALELNDRNPENWRALGKLHAAGGEFPAAENAYSRALELDPRDAWLWSARGDAFGAEGREDEALDSYRQASRLEPGTKLFRQKVGALVRKREGTEAALRYWDEVSAELPDWGRPHYIRAVMFLENNDIGRARREAELAARQEPGHRTYRNLLTRLESIPPTDKK